MESIVLILILYMPLFLALAWLGLAIWAWASKVFSRIKLHDAVFHEFALLEDSPSVSRDLQVMGCRHLQNSLTRTIEKRLKLLRALFGVESNGRV